MKKKITLPKEFLLRLVTLAAPIALQNLIFNSLSLVDTLMIGSLGSVELASVGLANQAKFILMLLLFGTGSGSGIFIAQFWGKKDLKSARSVTGLSLLISLSLSLIFLFISYFSPEIVLRIYSSDQEVIACGSQYLQIIALSLPLYALSFTLSLTLRSTGEVNIPLIVSAISLGLNTLLNYFLIFGNAGFPMMGVKGAAIATLISRIVELLLTIYFFMKKSPLAGPLKEFLTWPVKLIKSFIKTTLPVFFNEAFWGVGTSLFNSIYAHIGTESIAAFNITNTITGIAMVLFIGTGNACGVMTGHSIGRGDYKEAKEDAKLFCTITPILSFLVGILLFFSAPIIPSFFNISPLARKYTIDIIRIFSFLLPFKSLNLVIIVGILRGGGDTTFGMLFDLIGIWGIGLPLAFIAAFLFNQPIPIVFLAASSEEIIKVVFGLKRVFSWKWLKDLTHYQT